MPGPDESPLARFLTLADVAEVLSVTPREALELVTSGELPAIRVGARAAWRVERAVLDGYIEAKYEESRRAALWQQAQYADVVDLFPVERRREL